MSYNINILNSSGTKVAVLDGEECTATVFREINKEYGISLLYPIPANEMQGLDKSSYLTAWAARLQVYNLNDATTETFIITKTEKIKDSRGAISLYVEAEAKALYDLNAIVINAIHDYKNATPSTILTKILSYVSGWSSGTVQPTDGVSVRISYETALSALQKLLKACGGEMDIDEANSEIDILSSLGANNNVNVRAERNLEAIKNTQFSRNVVNKVFGVGGGQPPMTIADARHVVSSYNSGTGVLTAVGNKIVPEDDSWNTSWEVYFETGSEAGNPFTISDSVAGSTNDTLTINTGRSIAAGDKFRIRDTSHNDIDFIRAGTSISSYGTIEKVHQNSIYSNVINRIETPALDGTYTSGLCENWSKSGSPTVSENTTDTYITYGASSQRIQGTADDEGIYQAVTLPEASRYWTITAWVYITSGTVKVEIYDGSNVIASRSFSNSGWNRIEIKEVIGSTTGTVRIYQDGSGTSDFYVDAVQLTEGVLSRSFNKNCDAKDLWDEAYDFLADAKDPLLQYEINFIDLYKIDSKTYSFDEISLGDTVTITDADLGISAVTARVKKITWDVFNPEQTRHTVSNV